MKPIITAAFTLMLSSLFSLAEEKVEVAMEGSMTAMSDAPGRKKEIKIEIQRDAFDKKKIPLDEKIVALRSKLAFYELLKLHKIDPYKETKVKYRDRPLMGALKELLPDISVKFEGVDKEVTIRKMTANKVTLERVCEYLDNAAGVYFRFSKEGLIVIPAQKK